MSRIYRIKISHLYSPWFLGQRELLVAAGKILVCGTDLSALAKELNAVDIVHDGKVIPGLIDQHIHYTGGGDGDGPLARMPELSFEAIASAGITTSVGLLGSEIEAKNLAQLVRKANELEKRGLTTFVYTGAMCLPAPYIISSVRSDLLLIDKVIGAKSAIAERIYPNLEFSVLAALAGELILARSMTGKASVLHLHVGRLSSGLNMLNDLVDKMDFPIEMAIPTHINRSTSVTPLFTQGIEFAKQGGNLDFTACLGPLDGLSVGMDVVEAVSRALDAGVSLNRMTISTDSGVAVPDGKGGMQNVSPSILFRDTKRLVHEGGLSWTDALQLVTHNVAKILGLSERKGTIVEGADADLIFLDEKDDICQVMAGGQFVYQK